MQSCKNVGIDARLIKLSRVASQVQVSLIKLV